MEGLRIFIAARPLYLASASPRRVDFLRALGIAFTVAPPPEGTEPAPLAGEAPGDYARRAALDKARSVYAALDKAQSRLAALAEARSVSAALDKAQSGLATLAEARSVSAALAPAPAPVVIAADTIVVLEGEILGKPRDAEAAFAMLSVLSGKSHSVITGCAILDGAADAPRLFAVESRVHMWPCPPEALLAYARSPEPLDKAGAYAVQGVGAVLVRSIKGSWSNVVGLPLAELLEELLALGAIAAPRKGESA
jgi:septum formation protein